ncbi:uncharacterized protein LOC144071194 [Stigmatopora argus]
MDIDNSMLKTQLFNWINSTWKKRLHEKSYWDNYAPMCHGGRQHGCYYRKWRDDVRLSPKSLVYPPKHSINVQCSSSRMTITHTFEVTRDWATGPDQGPCPDWRTW